MSRTRLNRREFVRVVPAGLALALGFGGALRALAESPETAGQGRGSAITTRFYSQCTVDELLKAAPTKTKAHACGTLEIIGSDSGYTMRDQIRAGRTLVAFANSGSGETAVELGRLPQGKTLDDLQAALANQESVTPWFLDIVFPGGPGVVSPGDRAQVIVDLTPGEYVVFGVENPAAARLLTVVAGGSAASVDAALDLAPTLTVDEYSFTLPAALYSGKQIWKVVNAGVQPHEANLASVPDGTTMDDIMTIMTLEEGAPLPEGVPDPSWFVPVGGLGFISAGQTAWSILDLKPGTYAAFCYIPDQQAGAPHAFMGMIQVFAVTA